MFKRVLLKLSGESLKGNGSGGIDPKTVKEIAEQVKEIYDQGIEVGIVIGGGNLFRGQLGQELGMDRAQADYMGMLATVMNALAMQDSLESMGVNSRVMSALPIDPVCEPFIRRRALRHLEKGRVVLFAGGTGMPYFTTDTCAALRATEINAEVVLMAKNGVEGVYDKDPKKYPDANLFEHLEFETIFEKDLRVMDQTAAAICKENNLKIVVFNMNQKGNILKAAMGERIGTLVE